MKLVIGCDEAAYRLKEAMKETIIQLGHEVKDIGVYHEAPSLYPDIAQKLCACITDGSCERGILLCGTGIGTAVGHDLFSVERSIKSNDCQVLCMGARVIAAQYARLLVERWLECSFAGGASAEKVARIMEIEQEYRR